MSMRTSINRIFLIGIILLSIITSLLLTSCQKIENEEETAIENEVDNQRKTRIINQILTLDPELSREELSEKELEKLEDIQMRIFRENLQKKELDDGRLELDKNRDADSPYPPKPPIYEKPRPIEPPIQDK